MLEGLEQTEDIVTVSYVQIGENKSKDNFNFTNSEFVTIKITENELETSITGVKEVSIKSFDQLEYLLK